jgi:hypothetical protein
MPAPSAKALVAEDPSTPTERMTTMSILMNAPHGVTSVSVPVDSTPENTPIVQSATGLRTPVYPAPHVYVVSAGQIEADTADVSYLVQNGFIVVGGPFDTTAPRHRPAGSTVISGQWPIF